MKVCELESGLVQHLRKSSKKRTLCGGVVARDSAEGIKENCPTCIIKKDQQK